MSKYLRLTAFIALFLVTVGCLVCIGPKKVSALSASDWQAGRIIDDDVFFNSGTMNTGDIQNFLNSKMPLCDTNGTQPSGHGGYATRADWGRANGAPPPYTCLKDYTQSFGTIGADAYCGGISGGNKTAANIIYDVARACNVNPQTLIVLLQKEEALVTDDWPWPAQYQIATGYGCPDTAACDSTYYGFFNQVYNAGHQFRRYVQQPQLFNYAAGHVSFIGYNPNGGCGGTNVAIQNGATAALYNYTPYQPNAAALNNLYGTGDSCSAYGNRNFWRMFSDWFGATSGDGYTLGLNQDDNSQWVIYRGVKQYVPSGEIKAAWGLPDTPVTMSGNYIAGIPTGPTLTRLFHLIGDPALYFADGGKKYYVPSSQMKTAWGLDGQTESFVSLGLWSVPQHAGWLSYSLKNASSPALYMAEGLNGSNKVILRQYSTPDVFHAWEGDSAGWVTVSDTLFAEMDDAVGATLTGYTIKGPDPSQYQVIAGQKLYLSGAMAGVYNQTYQSVSQATVNRLVSSSPVTNFIRLPGNGVTIYMVDNGQKLPVSSGDVLRAWSPGGSISVNVLDQGFLNLLSTGTALSGYEADVSGQLYLVDGTAYSVPAGLDGSYRTGTIASVSAASMSLFPAATATTFVKGGGPSVYLLDNGYKRHITSSEVWRLWNGTRNEGLTQVSDAAASQFTDGGDVGYYFSTGGTNYVIDNGTYHSVSGAVATDWSLSSPTALAAGTRNWFTGGSALQAKVKVGSTYYRVKYGKSHATSDTNLATVWGVFTSPTDVTADLVGRVTAGNALNIYAKSTDTSDTRIFLVDNGAANFYHITSVEQMQNFGANTDITEVTPADLGTVGTALNLIKTSTSNSERVLDGGSKRDFTNSTVRGRWVTGSNVLTVSSALYNRFPDFTAVTGNIKSSSAPNVYNIDTGQKRWLQSQTAYQSAVSSYGAYSDVSNFLAQLLPTGSNIP